MNTSSRNGTIAELSFMADCLKNDIHIYKPIVDDGCDFITLKKNKTIKIQVKSSSSLSANRKGYSFGITNRVHDKGRYSNIDYFAFHILPLGLTYVMPSSKINKTKITIYPNSIKCKYNQYLRAFYLLK